MFEKCPNCLKRVIKGSKFCTHCGERMPLVAKEKKRKINRKFIDVDFTDGKKVFKRYMNYFLKRIKEPTVSMKKSMNKESFQFGLIQLIILILINSLTVLTLYRSINAGSRFSLNVSLFSLFVGATVIQAVYLLNTIISLYVTTNYLKKVPTTIQTITSRVGGLASPQLVLSIVLGFAVTTQIGPLYYLILSLIAIVSIASINFYLLSIKNHSVLSNFYTVIFAMALVLILQVITYTLILRFSTKPQIYPEIIRTILSKL